MTSTPARPAHPAASGWALGGSVQCTSKPRLAPLDKGEGEGGGRDSSRKTPLLSEEGWRAAPGWWKHHPITPSLITQYKK